MPQDIVYLREGRRKSSVWEAHSSGRDVLQIVIVIDVQSELWLSLAPQVAGEKQRERQQSPAKMRKKYCRANALIVDETQLMERNESVVAHAASSLLALALVYALLVMASVISGLLLKHGPAVVNPYSPAEEAGRFFAANAVALRVFSFFLFGSSVPLGIFAATVVSRLRFLGARPAGTYIALGGGFAAAASLAISGLCVWVLSVPEVSGSLATSRLMHFLVILFGGVSFAVAFGLLVADVSVTSYSFVLFPCWLVWFGIFIAVAGELSSLSLITSAASPLIPIVRLCGFIWLIAVGAKLPK